MCGRERPGTRRCDEGAVHIPPDSMERDPPNLDALLGPWIRTPAQLAATFAAASPMPHIVIDNFFAEPVARRLAAEFPDGDAGAVWHVYDNPLERKRACSDTSKMPTPLREAVLALCGPSVVEAMRLITGVAAGAALQADPYCHGGGLHAHSAGGKLDLHRDYSRHPVSGLERRFNLIVYLSEAWRDEYGGALELWTADDHDAARPGKVRSEPHEWSPVASLVAPPADTDALCRDATTYPASLPPPRTPHDVCAPRAALDAPPSTRRRSQLGACVPPLFNRALLFDTAAPAFHGFPRPITPPASVERRSIALYYLTPPRPTAPDRPKATYVATPGDAPDARLDELRALRSVRRLEPADYADVDARARDAPDVGVDPGGE